MLRQAVAHWFGLGRGGRPKGICIGWLAGVATGIEIGGITTWRGAPGY